LTPTAKTKWRDRLIENAVDFLTRAIDDFQDRPKYSIINFYTAIELFLKARLLQEHWSLIILKDPDRKKFESGDFVSVQFDVACDRLQNIVQSPVPERARKTFDTIGKHRNKMVHFFHEADRSSGPETESIVREQLRAWHDLRELLTLHWSPLFENFDAQFDVIDKKLSGHREFLRAKFDNLYAQIKDEKSRGIQFRICASCNFEAARVLVVLGDLLESRCLVCDHRDMWFDYTCSNCNKVSPLHDGGEFECVHCKNKDNTEAITESVNEFIATSDNYMDAQVPAHCSECEGYHTVVEYKDQFLCVVCFLVTEEVKACGWCGEYGNGDMEDSTLVGCTVCEGSAGYYGSKDD
jgi:hypothetical protein